MEAIFMGSEVFLERGRDCSNLQRFIRGRLIASTRFRDQVLLNAI